MSRIKTMDHAIISTGFDITSGAKTWADYLDFAAWMYKYRFQEQLAIFSQRPDARAVADMETWNRRVGRQVKRGASAITVPDLHTKGAVRYLFDYRDTQAYRKKSKLPGDIHLWQMEGHEELVQKALEAKYGQEENIFMLIQQSALEEVGNFFDLNERPVMDALNQCQFGQLAEDSEKATVFLRIATYSAALVIQTRCALRAQEPQETLNELDEIALFDQTPAIQAIGCAVNNAARVVLRRIERAIRAEERRIAEMEQQNAGRPETVVFALGNASAPVLQSERGRQEQVSGQVRLDEQPAQEEIQSGNPGADLHGGDTVKQAEIKELSRDSETNGYVYDVTVEGAVINASDMLTEEETSTLEKMVGDDASAVEVAQWLADTLSGREKTLEEAVYVEGRSDGFWFHITGEENEGIRYEWQEIADVKTQWTRSQLAAAATPPWAGQVQPDLPVQEQSPDPALDAFLRTGGNQRNGVYRIIAYHQMQGTDLPGYLRYEFCGDGIRPGGRGLLVDTVADMAANFAAWYDVDGIRIAHGNTVRSDKNSYLVTWEQAADRVVEMLNQGIYQPEEVVSKALQHERLECAQAIWNLHQNYNQEHQQPFFVDSTFFEDGGFPEQSEAIANRLADPDFLTKTLTRLNIFRLAYAEDRSILRWHYNQPLSLLERMSKLTNAPLSYPVQTISPDQVRQSAFVTEDEVDHAITNDGNIDRSLSIYSYFIHDHSRSEQAKTLSNLFGTGGYSHGVSHADDSFVDFDSRGVKFQRGSSFGDVQVTLSWQQYAKRVERMILTGRFLTPMMVEKMPAFLREQLARRIAGVFQFASWSKLPFSHEDYYDAKEKVMDALSYPDRIQELLDGMAGILAEMPEHPEDERLQRRRESVRGVYTDTISYREGTYSLLIPDQVIAQRAEKNGVRLPSYPDRKQAGTQLNLTEYMEAEGQTAPPSPPDLSGEPITRQGDTLTVGSGESFHEVEVTVTDEQWAQIQEAVPAETSEQAEAAVQEEPEPALRSVVIDLTPKEQAPVREDSNFRITDEHLGEGKLSEKYHANVRAIRTLKKIESENRSATPEEQEILSRYVGWGGLAGCFEERHSKYEELKNLLTDREYAAARASTLNAHYTSPAVIHAIYQAVEQMGFQSGRILEPSMGVGNFFGLLPDSMAESQLYGVELDSITGRMAKLLYPGAEITVAGFETTHRDNFFDLAVGNVPFGQYQVNDPDYHKLGFSIHNYFFAKALDQVRPGGIVAFVTSRYTMDAKSTDARRYLAQRAELLGAIRLPNNAFKANAGTDVVSDIIFLQKRERPVEVVPEWVFLGESENGFVINQYFADHPEMVLGTPSSESTQYGRQDYTVLPIEGAELTQQLQEAVSRLPSGIYQESVAVQTAQQTEPEGVLPPPELPVESFCIINGVVYFKENIGKPMQPYECAGKERERIIGMIQIRDAVRRVIQCQLDGGSDAQVDTLLRELNSIYDRFVRENGYLTGKMNQRAFQKDSSIYLLSSLEEVKNGETKKSDFFTKRTIRHVAPVTHCDTAQEALAVCLAESGKVSIDRIAQLTGQERGEVVRELDGRIYRIPGSEQYVPADEYLSGNVRRKLSEAKAAARKDPVFEANVKALEQVQPVDLTADEIDVRLGSTWIDPIYVKEFFCQLLRVGYLDMRSVTVHYVPESGDWHIEGKDRAGYIPNTETYGTSRMKASEIIERSLNLRDVRVYDTVQDADGKERRVLNADETVAARSKQELIQNKFKDWIFERPDRRAELVAEYNRRFNSYRNRSYDGSYLKFPGMNPEITLREHQVNAVARGLYGGNTLLAHVVGAGKTYEITAIAMESKRLGMAHKSMIVVPNHLTAQWGVEFLRLYPAAKVLVATERDFSTQNRKRFCTRIATGDWDAVVIGHSQFERIPLSKERQEQFLQEQIDSITEGIEAMKYQSGERWTVKNMERTRKGLEARLAKLEDSPKDENVINFEELGVDRIFVDEAQAYKNAFIYTKMQNVAGISQSESQRAFDLYQKIRYLDAETGGRGVIFATGTPISNSMVEMYVMQRYLQFDRLEEAGLSHFDAWASTFGEVTTSMELAPEGTGYRSRTRFAKFHNLPELMSMFQEVADIKTADELKLDVPTAHYETIVAQRTEIQAQLVAELSERASKVHDHTVSPEQDNMLRITSDGRKIGLDQRLIDPNFPDEPGSKVNLAVEEIMKIWKDSASFNGTQLVFCDFSTPTDPKKFNVYTDMKQKLIAAGIPEEQIAFIHDAKTKAAKNELFQKVNDGTVRVLFGSTEKMGAGTNCQERLVAIHDVDCPWRPGDLEQRAGRIVRQGNKNKDVYIKRYVTDATFDAYLYQTVENKQKFISQIMTSKTPVRSCEDVDESVLSYAEIKALCAGDPLIKEKMELDTEVTRLKVLRSAFKRQQFRLEDMVQRTLPNEIKETQNHIARMKQDVAHLKEVLPSTEEEAPFPVLKIGDTLCETRADAGKALRHLMSELQSTDPVAITTLYGFEVQLYRDSLFTSTYRAFLKGVCTYSVELGDSGLGNITRIENYIRAIPDMLDKTQNHLTDLQAQLAQAKEELGKPWAMEAEFQAKTARLTELDARLTLEDQNRDTAQAQDVEEDRPSEPMSFADRLFHAAKQAAVLNSQRTENQRQQPVRQI